MILTAGTKGGKCPGEPATEVANGNGFAAEVPNRFERRGIGLANTQARLRELYGSNQHFAFVKGDWLHARMPLK